MIQNYNTSLTNCLWRAAGDIMLLSEKTMAYQMKSASKEKNQRGK